MPGGIVVSVCAAAAQHENGQQENRHGEQMFLHGIRLFQIVVNSILYDDGKRCQSISRGIPAVGRIPL